MDEELSLTQAGAIGSIALYRDTDCTSGYYSVRTSFTLQGEGERERVKVLYIHVHAYHIEKLELDKAHTTTGVRPVVEISSTWSGIID